MDAFRGDGVRRSSYHIVDGSQPHSLLIIQARREGECGRPFGSLVVDVGMIQCCPRMFLELLVCWEGRWGGGELPATVSDGRRTGRLRGCLPFLRSGHVSARQHLYHRLQPSVVGTASIHTSRSSSVCPTRERERGREPGGLTREVERHLKMYHGAASEQASTLSVPIPL